MSGAAKYACHEGPGNCREDSRDGSKSYWEALPMKIGKSCVIITSLMALLLWPLFPAQAQWWQDKGLKEKYAISETQAKEMDVVYNSFQAKRKDMANASRNLQKDLTDLLEQEKVEKEAIEKSVTALEAVRNRLFSETVEARLAIRKILSEDQIKRIRAENPKLLSSEGYRPLRPLPKIEPRPGAGLVPQKTAPKQN